MSEACRSLSKNTLTYSSSVKTNLFCGQKTVFIQFSCVAFLDIWTEHAHNLTVTVNTGYANLITTRGSIGWEIKLCSSSYNAAVVQFFNEMKHLSGLEECLFSFMSSSIKSVQGSGSSDTENLHLFACCESDVPMEETEKMNSYLFLGSGVTCGSRQRIILKSYCKVKVQR